MFIMRFIIGFVFFGLLFYSIWFYFPETFQTLVSWVAQVFEFFRDLVENLKSRLSSGSSAPKEAPKVLFNLF